MSLPSGEGLFSGEREKDRDLRGDLFLEMTRAKDQKRKADML